MQLISVSSGVVLCIIIEFSVELQVTDDESRVESFGVNILS